MDCPSTCTPGPSKEKALNEVVKLFPYHKYVSEVYTSNILDESLTKYSSLGSLRGWIVLFKPEVLVKVNKMIKDRLYQRICMKLRILGTMLVLYRETIDRHYAPGSSYAESLKPRYEAFCNRS